MPLLDSRSPKDFRLFFTMLDMYLGKSGGLNPLFSHDSSLSVALDETLRRLFPVSLGYEVVHSGLVVAGRVGGPGCVRWRSEDPGSVGAGSMFWRGVSRPRESVGWTGSGLGSGSRGSSGRGRVRDAEDPSTASEASGR